MRVGLALVDLALGGAQTAMVQLAAGLAARGHAVAYHLAARRDDLLHAAPSLQRALDAVAAPVARPRDLLACDVVQLDGYHSLRRKLPYLAALRRCVETFHSLHSIRRSGPLYARHRVAVSRAVQAALPPPVQVIPNGIPLPPPAAAAGARDFDVAILGRIHPVKQHELFLEACALLRRRRGGLAALIVGGHPRADDHRRRIERGIADLRARGAVVHVTGDLAWEAVFGWLARARVLLVTSAYEGFGRMAVEAMACGTPVVANPVGGLPEVVEDGRSGLLARRDDPASFAELAARLLDDEALRRRLGRAGRAAAERRFSLAHMLGAYERLYEAVAAAAPRAR